MLKVGRRTTEAETGHLENTFAWRLAVQGIGRARPAKGAGLLLRRSLAATTIIRLWMSFHGPTRYVP